MTVFESRNGIVPIVGMTEKESGEPQGKDGRRGLKCENEHKMWWVKYFARYYGW